MPQIVDDFNLRVVYTINSITVSKRKKVSSFHSLSLCLKITEKVSFNIASEASYVYILSGQKFIRNTRNTKNGP